MSFYVNRITCWNYFLSSSSSEIYWYHLKHNYINMTPKRRLRINCHKQAGIVQKIKARIVSQTLKDKKTLTLFWDLRELQ